MNGVPTLLVVDDEKDFLEIMSANFTAAGFAVLTARNGRDALKIATEQKPDLVLMDIHMPGETGTDVALAIKQNPETAGMKVAFLTSLKEPWPAISGEKAEIARELGMDDFVQKTDNLDVIVAKVREILERDDTAAKNVLQDGGVEVGTMQADAVYAVPLTPPAPDEPQEAAPVGETAEATDAPKSIEELPSEGAAPTLPQ